MRLDLFLSNNGLANSRTHAANLIELSKVVVNGQIAKKASFDIKESDIVEIKEDAFDTLGEVKLQGALEYFNINLTNKVALDIGCSNGGFSKLLLDGGIKKLFALDVGECALPKSILDDKRVEGLFNTNIRYATKDIITLPIDFCTIDVSFISLKLVLPKAIEFLSNDGEILALIKPQFELDKSALTKKGIVKNVKLYEKCTEDIKNFVLGLGLNVIDIIKAPHPFKDKNQEYFILIKK